MPTALPTPHVTIVTPNWVPGRVTMAEEAPAPELENVVRELSQHVIKLNARLDVSEKLLREQNALITEFVAVAQSRPENLCAPFRLLRVVAKDAGLNCSKTIHQWHKDGILVASHFIKGQWVCNQSDIYAIAKNLIIHHKTPRPDPRPHIKKAMLAKAKAKAEQPPMSENELTQLWVNDPKAAAKEEKRIARLAAKAKK